MVLLEPGDKLDQVFRWQGLLGDQPHRTVRHQRDRLEILHHVERQGIGGAVDHVRLPVAENNRAAVGRRARDPAGADGAARPGRVFDDDGLPERLPHPVAEDARQRVGRPARRVGHDNGDWPRLKCLRRRAHDARGEQANCDCERLFHSTLPERLSPQPKARVRGLRNGCSVGAGKGWRNKSGDDACRDMRAARCPCARISACPARAAAESLFDLACLRKGLGAPHRHELAPFHSITSSAMARSEGGTSRPSALAACKWSQCGFCPHTVTRWP